MSRNKPGLARGTRACVQFAVFAGAIVAVAIAQQDFSKVEIKPAKVAGNVYMLEGSGGNIGVSIGEDGVLMIDDQYAPLADKIQAAIDKLGGAKPKFILNTHWHGDHTGGNAHFGKDGTLIAHKNVRERLASKQELFGRSIDAQPKVALPTITYEESLSIHFNGEELRVLHLPHGHTDGDSVVFFTGSKVVHMGDLMFMGGFPFVDLDHGGDVEGYLRNFETLMKQVTPDMKVIPGHGPLSTLEDMKSVQRMLSETIAIVKKKTGEGKTLGQIKSEGVPEEWKSWGEGFIKTDRWLETIHKSLSK